MISKAVNRKTASSIAACLFFVGCASSGAKIGEIDAGDAATPDAGRDAGHDAGRDAGHDAFIPPEPDRRLVNLFIEGHGFEEHEGRKVIVGVFNVDENPSPERFLRGRRGRTITGGRFDVEWYGAIKRGVPQRISVFVDYARSTLEYADARWDVFTCSVASRDVMWTPFEGSATEDVRLVLGPPATTDPAACEDFYSPGDLDRDGCVSPFDRAFWFSSVPTIGIPGALDGDPFDVNMDREVTSQDLTELEQHIDMDRCYSGDAGTGDAGTGDAGT